MDPTLREEYLTLLAQARAEIAPVSGITSLHSILLERFTFLYAVIRSMEANPLEMLDLQRYNQLTGLWLKVSSDLISSYREIYSKGAANELFVDKIVSIVSEEVRDPDILKRIRSRIAAVSD